MDYCILMIDCSRRIILSSPILTNFLCYPKLDHLNYYKRLCNLYSLDIKFVITGGETTLFGINILGKGSEGLVLKVEDYQNKVMALKIKRTDSCRLSMLHEFNCYKYSNRHGIGPKVYYSNDDLLLMELAEGKSILSWFLNSKLDLKLIRQVIVNVLTQCYILDTIHLDHGQLNRLNDHVIVSHDGFRCTVVDFESASVERMPSNFTSAFQGIFFKGIISTQINKYLDYAHKKPEFMRLLHLYKKNDYSKEIFDSIMALI